MKKVSLFVGAALLVVGASDLMAQDNKTGAKTGLKEFDASKAQVQGLETAEQLCKPNAALSSKISTWTETDSNGNKLDCRKRVAVCSKGGDDHYQSHGSPECTKSVEKKEETTTTQGLN